MKNKSLDQVLLKHKNMSNWDIVNSLEELQWLFSGCINLLTTGSIWNEEDTRFVLIHVLKDMKNKLRKINHNLADRFKKSCEKEE